MARPVHLILHVPKCAGRSMELHLEAHLDRRRLWRPRKRRSIVPVKFLQRKWQRPPARHVKHIDAVCGHNIGQSIEELFPDREIKRSAVLRDPIKRMLSWYNYSMMVYLTRGQAPMTLGLFVRSHSVDPAAHFLLERWLELPWSKIFRMTAEQKVELLDAAFQNFDHVVDISKANDLFGWHCRDLGVPEEVARSNTMEEWVAKTDWKPLRPSDLTRADRELLDKHSPIDSYLWRRWALGEDIAYESPVPDRYVAVELARPMNKLRKECACRLGWAI